MYKNILVALDHNPSSEKIFHAGLQTALAFNSKLTLCHIKKNTVIYSPIDPTGMLSTTQIFTKNYSYTLDDQLEKYKVDALASRVNEVEIVQTYSASPGLAIAEVIAPGYEADLIICGASNKSNLDRFLLGSVSFDLVKHAKCDVKIIRNEEN